MPARYTSKSFRGLPSEVQKASLFSQCCRITYSRLAVQLQVSSALAASKADSQLEVPTLEECIDAYRGQDPGELPFQDN